MPDASQSPRATPAAPGVDAFRAVVEAAVDAVVLMGEDGRIELFNPAAERIFGYRADEVLGRDVAVLMGPQDGAAHAGHVARYLNGGPARVIGKGREVVGRRRDGRPVTLHLTVGEWARDGRRAFVAIIRDLSRERRLEAAVEAHAARYAAVVAGMAEGLVVQRADGTIIAANPAAERILGLDASAIAGRTSGDPRWRAVHPDGTPWPGSEHPAMETLRTGETVRSALMGVERPSGERVWIEVSTSPIEIDDEDGLCVASLFLDVTARVRLEAEREALLDIASAVARDDEPADVLALVVDRVTAVFGAVGAAVVRFDDPQVATLLASAPHPPEALAPGGRIALTPATAIGRVAVDGRAAIVLDDGVVDDPLANATRLLGAVGAAAAPVTISNLPWGALGLWAADGAHLVPEVAGRLGRFAELVATAIATAEARDTLSRHAATDPLTELPNQRTFDERLHGEIARARRHDHPLALILIDIDRFKRINDTFGHQAGNRVLRAVGRALQAQARDGEIVARIGGEEFAWLVPEEGLEGVLSAAERARRTIAELDVPDAHHVTISVGVAMLGERWDADVLFGLADQALYEAKRGGRNLVRVATATQPPASLHRDTRAQDDRALASVRALARTIDARDASTREHSDRVARLAELLALECGWSPARARSLHEAALLHDIGKIGVRDEVLQKPGPLTDAERAEICNHPVLGARIAGEVLTTEQVAWIRGHHERVDGRGYPDGLAGPDIPLGAQILSLADAFDAMTTVRSYRPKRTPAEAVSECLRCEGSQFDAIVVHALLRLAGRGELEGVTPLAPPDDEDGGLLVRAQAPPTDAVRAPGPTMGPYVVGTSPSQ